MADGMTTDGIDRFRASVEALPDRVRAASRGVALATAGRVQAGAKAILAAKTHGTGATADAINVKEDAANQMFVVESPGAPHVRFSLHTMKRSGRQHTQRVTVNMLPVWLEYGTVKMPARSYMRPATKAEEAQHNAEMQQVIDAIVRDTLT